MRVTKGLEDSIRTLEIEKRGETLWVTFYDKERPRRQKVKIYKYNREQTDKITKLLEFALGEYKAHYSKPFVWGGVSPLTLQEQPNDTFQSNVPRYQTQPKGSWREGLPMWPGFDCVGFLRWIYGNNGSELFRGNKKTANEYRQLMGATPSDYNLNTILENAKPGDVIFKCDSGSGRAMHGMIYLGNGLVLECAGMKKPDYKNIPKKEWNMWRELSAGRNNSDGQPATDKDRGGIQISPISKYSHYKIAIATPDILKG